MTKILITIFTGLLLTLTACIPTDPNTNIDEGKVEGDIYTSNEIGWTIEIPKGWTVIDIDKTKEMNEKGRKALEKTVEKEVKFKGLKHLISFQKDPFNVFQSSSEPFELEYEGEWEEANSELKEIIYATYSDQGIKADTTATTIEEIDGIEFQSFTFLIYSSKGAVIMRQTMFSRLINGFDFGVNINYNNEKDRDELLKVFKNSKFKK